MPYPNYDALKAEAVGEMLTSKQGALNTLLDALKDADEKVKQKATYSLERITHKKTGANHKAWSMLRENNYASFTASSQSPGTSGGVTSHAAGQRPLETTKPSQSSNTREQPDITPIAASSPTPKAQKSSLPLFLGIIFVLVMASIVVVYIKSQKKFAETHAPKARCKEPGCSNEAFVVGLCKQHFHEVQDTIRDQDNTYFS